MGSSGQNVSSGTDQVEKVDPKVAPCSRYAKWKKKFLLDFLNVKLIPLKALMFLVYGANWCLVPFLSLQARSLGITGEEVGLIYSFLVIPSLIAPPAIGMLADKVGNFKVMLILTTIASGAISLLFLMVPVGRMTHQLPSEVHFNMSCSPFNSSLILDDIHGCDVVDGTNFDVVYTKCFFECQTTDNFAMEGIGNNLICKTPYNCFVNASESLFPSTGLSQRAQVKANSSLDLLTTRLEASRTGKQQAQYVALDPFCPRPVSVKLKVPDNQELCTTKCQAKALRKEACSTTVFIEEIDPTTTFYSHLLVRFFFEFSLATSMPLLDGALITVVQCYGGDFGLQRMYANLGMMILTPITGFLIDTLSVGKAIIDYSIIMYVYCGLKLISAVIVLTVDLRYKVAAATIVTDFWKLIRQYEVIAFIIATLLAGSIYGFMETFLFWLLEDLGADNTMMGLTITVGSGAGVILLIGSSFIIKKLGHVNAISVGLMFYIIRFVGYTVISNPWWAMPFEMMEAITTSLLLVTFISYSAYLSSPTTAVTLQGIYMGLYNGVGRAAGSMVGGYCINFFGVAKTFRIMAGVSGFTGMLYFVTNMIYQSIRTQEDQSFNQNTKEITKAPSKAHENPAFDAEEKC